MEDNQPITPEEKAEWEAFLMDNIDIRECFRRLEEDAWVRDNFGLLIIPERKEQGNETAGKGDKEQGG
jgi:hypothetical protein